MSELNRNARRMVDLLVQRPMTVRELSNAGVYNPALTADVLDKYGYLLSRTEGATESADTFALVGRQGELALA